MSSSAYMNVDEIALAAAKKAIKLYKQEEKEKSKRNRLHNTGLLMSRYVELSEHYEKIRYRASDIEDDLDPEDYAAVIQEDIIIDSIKRSKIKTMIFLSQIDYAIKELEEDMRKKGEGEKCEVLKRLYMDPAKKRLKFYMKVKEVSAEMTNKGNPCSESSVKRWANEMLDELSIKIFGVDGLRLDV